MIKDREEDAHVLASCLFMFIQHFQPIMDSQHEVMKSC